MAKTKLPYPPQFRRQMVELVRAGRTLKVLAAVFEPTALSWAHARSRVSRIRMSSWGMTGLTHMVIYTVLSACTAVGLHRDPSKPPARRLGGVGMERGRVPGGGVGAVGK